MACNLYSSGMGTCKEGAQYVQTQYGRAASPWRTCMTLRPVEAWNLPALERWCRLFVLAVAPPGHPASAVEGHLSRVAGASPPLLLLLLLLLHPPLLVGCSEAEGTVVFFGRPARRAGQHGDMARSVCLALCCCPRRPPRSDGRLQCTAVLAHVSACSEALQRL